MSTLPASRCRSCGAICCPPRPDCSSCMASDPEAIEVSGEGTLYSFTELHSAPAGFVAPYVLGVVDLDGGGRVMGTLVQGEPRVGMRVEVSRELRIRAGGA